MKYEMRMKLLSLVHWAQKENIHYTYTWLIQDLLEIITPGDADNANERIIESLINNANYS